MPRTRSVSKNAKRDRSASPKKELNETKPKKKFAASVASAVVKPLVKAAARAVAKTIVKTVVKVVAKAIKPAKPIDPQVPTFHQTEATAVDRFFTLIESDKDFAGSDLACHEAWGQMLQEWEGFKVQQKLIERKVAPISYTHRSDMTMSVEEANAVNKCLAFFSQRCDYREDSWSMGDLVFADENFWHPLLSLFRRTKSNVAPLFHD